jgi:hypothetical protein
MKSNFLARSQRVVCVGLLLALAGSVAPLPAQRATILDFTTTSAKPRKHPPKPFPAGTMLGGRPGGMTDGKLIVSLVSTDKNEYSLGEEINYTLEVRTRGEETVKFPTVTNVADLEPDNPDLDFNYKATEIWLGLIEDSKERWLHVPLLRLYDSDDMPWSQIELKPGMSIEIRGRARLQRPDLERPSDSEGRLFDGPYMGSTDNLPSGEVRVVTSCWRGDKYFYEGRTHLEYPSSFIPEEMTTAVYGGKITLLPASDH